jgi:hypothetical protein
VVVEAVAAAVAADHALAILLEVLMTPLSSAARRSAFQPAFILSLCATLLLPSEGSAHAGKQDTYPSPQAAVDALIAAVKADDVQAIIHVLGPEGRELASSGDPVADAATRQKFAAAYDEAHNIEAQGERATLILGNDAFPFPIPLVAQDNEWRFDTEEGVEEILDRRIGENELSVVEVMRAYVDAQREYAEADRDGKGVQYARRILSSPGLTDGLYWPTEEGEPESPLGPLIADARGEGYSEVRKAGVTPYHGYVFRILTAQGKGAEGGARDYIVRGRMIGGFGLIAAPAEYGNSGVKTFIVNQEGRVFEKDLGDDTARLARRISSFNPDTGWTEVAAEP